MTKKTTKRALFSSVMALILCFSMLVGTTFAWFTDEVKSGVNQIVAGNLDIELYHEDNQVTDTYDKLFEDILWEPGAVAYENITVKNEGTLQLKYQLSVNFDNATPAKNGKTLADALYVAFVEGGFSGDREYAKTLDFAPMASFMQAGQLNVTDHTSDTYGIVIYWLPTEYDNDFNMNNEDKADLSIDLGIKLFATQLSGEFAESDSFGKDYDNGAFIPGDPEALPATGEGLVLNGSVESKTTVTVPAAVAEALKAAGATGLSVDASAPVVDANNKTVTFKTLELVDQDGNEVDLSNATAKVTVKLYVGGAFAKDEQVEVFHDGAFVTYATVDAEGYISYEVSHFCEVSVKVAEEVVLDNTIDSVKEFIAFAEAVNGGKNYKGETVVLGADLDLAGVTWTPIGTSSNPFQGTFDGNGKVIKNLSVLMDGKSNVGLFGYTTDGEIKNVTIENAKVAGRLNVGVVAGTPYTSKYTNITVKGHVEVDGMAYVGGVAGKNAYANWNNVTVNVDSTSYVNANSVENDTAYRTYVGGVVGFNGEGGHAFTNITSNINVIGSTCDIGGAFGIAHYNNKFENITVTGDVTCTGETNEIGGIAGVWHNENGTTVTFTNCTYNGELPIVGAAYSKTGNGSLVIDGKAYVAVNTADELVAALESKSNVIFVDNIKVEPAKMSNAYGKTGINVKYGQIIDGNGYTLNVQGAGGTWDSGINTTGGLIKNITVTGSFRGIFINHTSEHSEKVVLENVVIGGNGTVYTISCDQGLYQGIEATNCTFNGWTSFAKTAGEAKFVNCSFGEGSGYAYCRPYSNTEFVNCTFSEGYAVDTTRATVTFTNCANPNE